jgi:predicted esterase YcpF (UPF0227 family)
MILYLHGFRSSPKSFKAQVLADRMTKLGRSAEYLCPQLPASPRQAIELASSLVQQADGDEIALIGSSLGGYYATWLAEQFGVRAALLNPAVKPPRDLEKYVGVMKAFHSDDPFEFKREYVAELKEFSIEKITRSERYFLVAATGDEVLDWREMTDHYHGVRQRIIQGGDHALSDFEEYVNEVLAFCGIEVGNTH